ncbi:hypothetical protein C8Q78DRAFT_1022475 [Trametes maxima]|nr:hypothetical protein C8Q78DRAFT_1022475 [Trametes maxima]
MPGQPSAAPHHFTPNRCLRALATRERGGAATLLLVRVLSFLLFSFLLNAFSLWEGLRTRVHGRLCRIFARPPSQVYRPNQSAVVIVGADDDVGRHLALSFSELGCTVFALCPDKPAAPRLLNEALLEVSNVSSLIQEWHKRIKRSGRSPWGLLAPIVLDMNSGTQRTHAVETVDAYCTAHHLRLSAVIVLPATGPPPPKPPASGPRDAPTAWPDILRQCHVEGPIAVVQAYSDLLAAASGRVVLLLTSGDQLRGHPAHLGVLQSVARGLRQELGTLGIKVTTVSTGPFAPASKRSAPAGYNASTTGTPASSGGGDYDRGVLSALREMLRHFSVRYEDVWCVLRDIVRSQ